MAKGESWFTFTLSFGQGLGNLTCGADLGCPPFLHLLATVEQLVPEKGRTGRSAPVQIGVPPPNICGKFRDCWEKARNLIAPGVKNTTNSSTDTSAHCLASTTRSSGGLMWTSAAWQLLLPSRGDCCNRCACPIVRSNCSITCGSISPTAGVCLRSRADRLRALR